MKNTIVRYGLYGAAILIGGNLLSLAVLGIPEPEDFATGEVIGYATILVALVPVVLGIRHYRNQADHETPGFWACVLVGLGIAALPALAFGLYNYVYVTVIDPDFQETYFQYTLDQAQASMPADAYAAYAADLEAQHAVLTHPAAQSVVMFATVLLIGVVFSLAASLYFQWRRTRPETPART